jgi:hypothetical protein
VRAVLNWIWFIICGLVVGATGQWLFWSLVGTFFDAPLHRLWPGWNHTVYVSLVLNSLLIGYLAAFIKRSLWGAVAVGLAASATVVISRLITYGYWPAPLPGALPYGLILLPFLLGGLIAVAQMKRRARKATPSQ